MTLVLPPFLQALGRPARRVPAALEPGAARASRKPQLPGRGPDAPGPSAVGLHWAQPTCVAAASGAHPVRDEGVAVSKKQKKKKTQTRVSVANGGEKASEKPAAEDSPLSSEAQARVGSPVNLGASLRVVWSKICWGRGWLRPGGKWGVACGGGGGGGSQCLL